LAVSKIELKWQAVTASCSPPAQKIECRNAILGNVNVKQCAGMFHKIARCLTITATTFAELATACKKIRHSPQTRQTAPRSDPADLRTLLPKMHFSLHDN
jgi:hypothetical protein